jgi:glycosyltransferase involved in cell wall biosynthesis
MGLSPSKTVFLSTGNFVALKQFDKLIEVFHQLSGREEFVLLIAGHGDQASTGRLQALCKSPAKQTTMVLHPYVTGEQLRNLYWASDLYISTSTGEGASVSVMKAMACGVPVLSTPVGETSERMRRYEVGKFVPIHEYDEWKRAIEEILDKGLPPALDRTIAREAYDWPQVARRFLAVYEALCKEYFGPRVGAHV